MNKVLRVLFLCIIFFAPLRMSGVGFTPTEGGLVVDLKKNDRFLLSTWIDVNTNGIEDPGEEFFVCDYPSYTGGRYNYASTTTLKLIPQDADATEPSPNSIWRVDTALVRPENEQLGKKYPAICYTMWSKEGNNTILLTGNFKTQGQLSNNKNNSNLADVVFVVPTRVATTSFDPDGTLGKGAKFSGVKGRGFLNMPYREVFWLDIPRNNAPKSYTNASVVGFNTTTSNYDYAKEYNPNGTVKKKETATKGQALYSYADDKHKPTKRTLFRLYVLDEETVTSCPDADYYFAYDEQYYAKYRKGPDGTNTIKLTDSTAMAKFLTVDHLTCMDSIPSTTYYQTDLMRVPDLDSAYYYVGYHNHFPHTKDGAPFEGKFTHISELPLQYLSGFNAPRGALGRMVVDTTNTGELNLGVSFRPAGVFLKISTGVNVEMHPEPGDTSWITNEMWHITDYYASLKIRATLYTGPEFSMDDPGMDLVGWSKDTAGTSVPVVGGGDIIGKDGWCRVYVNKNTHNGGMEFVLADGSKWIRYDNNGALGTDIPDGHPALNATTVAVSDARLKEGFDFKGWATSADGDVVYHPGDVIDLNSVTLVGDSMFVLYAVAEYTNTYNIALSFIHPVDGKRYFLNQPGSAAPRMSRARHYDDWTNTWQGMLDAENSDPNYLSTFELRHPISEVKAYETPGMPDMQPNEFVLDPRHYTIRGYEDSLTFFDQYAPSKDMYIGLYYTDPNSIVANNTWAGLFTTSSTATATGWPDYTAPEVDNAKLQSTRYVKEEDPDNHPDSLTLFVRGNNALGTYVKYNVAGNQFDATVLADSATEFMLSNVIVADAHYIVLPDTTEEWTNEIVFDDLSNTPHKLEQVWSKLIGKQLMACMMVDGKRVYFHPNRDKLLTSANDLRSSTDFRLTQSFSYIRDARVESVGTVDVDDKPTMEDTGNDFCCNIISGHENPMDVVYRGNYIDIEDTLRVRLTQGGISKIKAYYGRWNDNADGLYRAADGSRYRDIIVRTKTYHYSEVETKLVLTPESPIYIFNPFAGTSKVINFTMTKVTSRQLLDSKNNPVGAEEIISSEDVTSYLTMGSGICSFAAGGTCFAVNGAQTGSQHATLYTTGENSTPGENIDTLVVSTNVTIGTETYPVRAQVPLLQTTLDADELIWSAVDSTTNVRYYIMANSSGLLFHQYTLKDNMLYKKADGKTQLKLGAASTTTDEYITPWSFNYVPGNADQLMMWTEYGVDKKFVIEGSTGAVSDADPSVLTYRYVDIHRNDDNNEEELIRLKYGSDQWLKFQVVAGVPSITVVNDSLQGTVFTWGYLDQEYCMYQKNAYPNGGDVNVTINSVTFGYNTNRTGMTANVQTRYKAIKRYAMLLDNKVVYLCREDEEVIANLINPKKEWRTKYEISLRADARDFDGDDDPTSGLSITTNSTTLTTTVSQTKDSPKEVKYRGKYVDIVDTLEVQLSLQLDSAPEYRFINDWKNFKSIEDAHLKIPLIRRTYHEAEYDSLVCLVEGEEFNHAFPSQIVPDENDTYTFVLSTENHTGRHILNVLNESVELIDPDEEDVTESGGMNLNDPALAEVRLVDDRGNTPSWCRIINKTENTITVKALENGIRSPRQASIYLAYIVTVGGRMRFVSSRLTVSQSSLFQYTDNQHLVHTQGASGDELTANGMQQVHENKRILYYYNPTNINHSPDQNVELPLRERSFYGWWRWFRENDDPAIGDTDIPDSLWVTPPRNVGKYNIAYRTIGEKVPVDPEVPDGDSVLMTMGRYTVFHYPANQYGNKADPPSKTPLVCPPTNKDTVVYAVDLSNYYDNLPLSMKNINQVDAGKLDTMQQILEPTLSIREVFELHPWTEMAERMENYKSRVTGNGEYELENENYMEDHVMKAPTGNRLLLTTEQRYKYSNLKKTGHSESLLGYYMRDDNWDTWDGDPARQDTMIWCGGWDADCDWYIYNPGTKTYSPCTHTITESDDFLQVPAKNNISEGHEFDTVYYCLRARSKKSDDPDEDPEDGEYWFNICRYTLIYHNASKYGPKLETRGRALITNEEIEEGYEVLERLNFDYNKPGTDYTIYPHPLPWADASYGYTYPLSPSLPVNRYHDETDFPNHGEYGIINKIPYAAYWRKMEQHGGAANGYMIYCDGMSSAGQVAALSLNTTLCAGQKMFFSGYVGNPSNQEGKANPNFIISVQGSVNGTTWDNITSYITGDIQPSDNWYQIYFPIEFNESINYHHFRVSITNVSSNWDGNDFVIDDMCIFATTPPLIACQGNTTCKDYGSTDAETHVLLRVDYHGITGEGYNNTNVFYTIEQMTPDSAISFVEMDYINPGIKPHSDESKPDTVYGQLFIPAKDYEPQDSIFRNVNDLILRYDTTNKVFKEGYIYEILEGNIRPVKYTVQTAIVSSANTYTVHMSSNVNQMLNSICGMTSNLKISSRMVLELNGEEQPEASQIGLCANSTYDLSLRVKGSLYKDSIAPIDVTGSCYNDWLLYGDTAEESSLTRYGYKYQDIVTVIRDILRYAPMNEYERNSNRFAPNLASINKTELKRIQDEVSKPELTDGVDPYTLIAHLVNNGFLTLYKAKLTASVMSGDSLQYCILPIVGSGTEELQNTNVEVCPNPIIIKLKPTSEIEVPLIIGGLHRDSTQMAQPVVFLANEETANDEIKVHVDSIKLGVGIYSVELRSTDDPNFREGIHSLKFIPDKDYPSDYYYVKGDTILLEAATSNNYRMKAGYNYTFNIVMQTLGGSLHVDPNDPTSCEVGKIPFVLSVVPDYLRWDPQTADNTQWNNPDNWIGVTEYNRPLHDDAHFAPLPSTNVIIPSLDEGLPYPVLPDLTDIETYDSVKQVGFEYNKCDVIRFMPGAAIGQQQRMTYNKAVVDMSMPRNQWAFRSAPVKGMLSGDLYMSNADLYSGVTPWEVGAFDLEGRSHTVGGNASFYLSVYSRKITHKGNGDNVQDTVRSAAADWSRVTNAMTDSLLPAQGWAVYTKTISSITDPIVRLPKNDDRYYYFYQSGGVVSDRYEDNLRALRKSISGGHAGELAYTPVADEQTFSITNEVASTSFVFGNPTMGYIDIWGFIADNPGLTPEISYIQPNGKYTYTPVTQAVAENELESPDTITNQHRYLPPMHAIVLTAAEGTTFNVTLKTKRVVTSPRQKKERPVAPAPAQRRSKATTLSQGIMTVTAINPVSSRCNSRLLIGQGYNAAIRTGEDAVLTTINIDHYSTTSAPATPFNIYAYQDGYGLSIDLLDSVVNVPIAFYMSELPFNPVSKLWFTGVNTIDGQLVLYDAWTDTERLIRDGICLDIETPEKSHQVRYYIRRRGFNPNDPSEPVATGVDNAGWDVDDEQAQKIIRNGHVYILRKGQIYTIYGQKVK